MKSWMQRQIVKYKVIKVQLRTGFIWATTQMWFLFDLFPPSVCRQPLYVVCIVETKKLRYVRWEEMRFWNCRSSILHGIFWNIPTSSKICSEITNCETFHQREWWNSSVRCKCRISNVKQTSTYERKEKKENEIWSRDTSMDTVYVCLYY